MENQQKVMIPTNPFVEKSKSDQKRISYEKVIGYMLLLLGLLMIFVALFLLVVALSGNYKPPKVSDYKLPPLEIAMPTTLLEPTAGAQLPDGFELSNKPNTTKLKLPDEILNDSIGIIYYFLLMSFLASAGTKVSGIGIKMLKDIKIKV